MNYYIVPSIYNSLIEGGTFEEALETYKDWYGDDYTENHVSEFTEEEWADWVNRPLYTN